MAAFASSMDTLDALERAERTKILITRVTFPPGQPNGVSLGLLARAKCPGVRVLFTVRREVARQTDGVGEFLAAPVTPADILAKVREILATSDEARGADGNADHH